MRRRLLTTGQRLRNPPEAAMAGELSRILRRQLDAGKAAEARRVLSSESQQIAEIFRAESRRRGPGAKRAVIVVK